MDKASPLSVLPAQCLGQLLACLPGSISCQELHRLCLWRETQHAGVVAVLSSTEAFRCVTRRRNREQVPLV